MERVCDLDIEESNNDLFEEKKEKDYFVIQFSFHFQNALGNHR